MTSDWVTPFNGAMGSATITLTYGYDAANNRTSLQWSDGFTAAYGFDAANRVSSVSFGGHSVSYTYDSLGRRTALNRSSGANTSYAYEPDDDLASISHGFAGGGAAAFSYGRDAAGRIVQIDYSRGDMEWKPQEAYARSFGVVSATNQVASMGGAAVGYDANGNITGYNGWTYGWTFGNRLIQTTAPGRTVTYAYDSDDRRTMVIDNGVMTRTVWSGADEIGVYDTNGGLVRRFIPDGTGAPDARLATVEATGAIYWHHADHQGSVFATSNSAGAPVQIVNYSPNGEVGTRIDGTQHTAPPFGSPFGYTGRHYDESTGLYHYRARYYHPALGQFMSTDPIGSKDDPNLYLYVANDPVNNVDPDGEQARNLPQRPPRGMVAGSNWGPAQYAYAREVQLWNLRGQRLDRNYSGYSYFGTPNAQSARQARDQFARFQARHADAQGVNLASNQPGARYQNYSGYSVAFEAQVRPGSGSRAMDNVRANSQLQSTMESNPAFASQMRDLGVQLPRDFRLSPNGWTWHHGEASGVMQLVPRPQHENRSLDPLLHPGGQGGFANWGRQ